MPLLLGEVNLAAGTAIGVANFQLLFLKPNQDAILTVMKSWLIKLGTLEASYWQTG